MRNQDIKLVTPIGLCIQALGYWTLGTLALFEPDFVGQSVYYILLAVLIISALLSLISLLAMKENRKSNTLARAMLMVAAAGLLFAYPHLLRFGVGIFVGVWALGNGAIDLGFAYQLKRTNNRSMKEWIVGSIWLAFGLALILAPLARFNTVYIWLGAYFMCLGASYFADFIGELVAWDEEGRYIKRFIRIRPPVLITAFLPTRVLDQINRAIEMEEPLMLEAGREGGRRVDEGNRTLEVFFHLGKHVAFGFGHVDLSFRGVCYSYGCYDEDSNRVFGAISDGTVAIAPREVYIPYMLTHEDKKLIGFTFSLSDAQEAQVALALEHLMDTTQPWAAVKKDTGFEYYKVVTGPYQIYNAVKTNCVALVEQIVQETGLPVLPTNGIITPGTYMAYLERQLEKRNGMVVHRRVYLET